MQAVPLGGDKVLPAGCAARHQDRRAGPRPGRRPRARQRGADRRLAGHRQVDADGDGARPPAGRREHADGTWAWSLTNAAPAQAGTVTITATDKDGAAATTTFTLIVVNNTNHVPVITSLTSDAADIDHASATGAVTINGAYTDSDGGDRHHLVINWGDGAQTNIGENNPHINQTAHTFAVNHIYATGGTFTITVALIDNRNGSATKTATAIVSGVSLQNGVLTILGTNGRDIIHVALHGSTYRVDARLNAQWHDHEDDYDCNDSDDDGDEDEDHDAHNARHQHFTFNVADMASISILGLAGNDRVAVGKSVVVGARIDGGAGDDRIWGGAGNDLIVDMLGNNRIHVGKGNDNVTLGDGANRIWTDGGDDSIRAGNGHNQIHVGRGENTMFVGNGSNSIWTDGGMNAVTAGAGNNEIHAGGGADTIVVGGGNNSIWTDGGNDTITTGNGNNEIHAGSGNNSITTGGGDNRIWSGDGNNVINAGNGKNEIHTGSGDDIINTGAGNDQIWSGAGNDNINAGDGDNTVDAGAGNDLVRSGAGKDILNGGAGNDILIAGAGDDTINGGDDRDILAGGLGADKLFGNGDDDLLVSGYTSYDSNDALLGAVMKEWCSNHSYADRVMNLSGVSANTYLTDSGMTLTRTTAYSARANGNAFLCGADCVGLGNQTVFSDSSVDQLTGNAGSDWFLANTNNDSTGEVADVILDSNKNEAACDIDLNLR